MNPRRAPRTDAGSATVEAVIGVPVFLLLVSLAVFGGRLAITHQAVQSAANDAARAASLARTAPAARQAAERSAAASLSNQQIDCRTTGVTVDTRGFQVAVGVPAAVHVTVSCAVPLDSYGFPGAPDTRLVTATMSSPLDTFRARG